MEKAWVGRSAGYLQVILGAMGAGVLGFVAWAVLTILHPQHGQRQPVGVTIAMAVVCVLTAGLIAVIVWAVRLYAPLAVVLDDRGVLLSQNGAERFIGWEDIEEVWDYHPVRTAPGIVITPRPEFFAREGQKRPRLFSPRRMKWTLPGYSFTLQQMDEMLPALRYHIERAGGTYVPQGSRAQAAWR